MSEEKKKLEQILLICSKCEEKAYIGSSKKLCRDIPISEKIFIGCGEWKKDGELILNQNFYNELKKRMKIKQVIDDLIK